MKQTVSDVSWSAASPVSSDAKEAICLDLETRVQVIVYRKYVAILDHHSI